ncbi:MAG: tyrosine-type recombinase/integrase [Thermodesulfobacteriota bacterium]
MACVTRRRDRWTLDFYDQKGKRHCLFMPKRTSKRKANEKLGEIEKKVRHGTWVSLRELPHFNEFADTWLASKEANIRHSTHEQYRGHVEKHLKPYFEGFKINHVNFDAIEQFKKHCLEKHTALFERALDRFQRNPWFEELKIIVKGKPDITDPEGQVRYEEAQAKIAKLLEEERERFESAVERINNFARPIATATLRKILITLGSILTHAVRMRYIDFNPAREVEKPKGKGLKKEQEEMVILKPEEIRVLLDNTATQKERVLFMTAALTGMRQGELLGLQWGDIDFLNSQILVRRTYNHGECMEPKSETSRRRIDIGPDLVHELKKWQLACPKGELNLVFSSNEGTWWDAQNMVRRAFIPALRRAKLPIIKFHSLRHGFASLLIEQGENPKYIQNQMGHHSINVTMDIYGHLFKNVNQEAASKLGKKVLGEEGSVTLLYANAIMQ